MTSAIDDIEHVRAQLIQAYPHIYKDNQAYFEKLIGLPLKENPEDFLKKFYNSP